MKYNGFTLIEVLVSISILFIVVEIFVPISILLFKERTVLSERRVFSSYLHDELQRVIWDETVKLPKKYNKKIRNRALEIEFTNEEEFMKGCASWINVRNKKEDVCFYAYKK